MSIVDIFLGGKIDRVCLSENREENRGENREESASGIFLQKKPKKKIEFSIELAGAQEDANWRGGVFLFRLRGVSTPPVPRAQRWPRSPRGPMPEISFVRPPSTPPVPMAQRWPRSPRGPVPELSFARPPSPTAGHYEYSVLVFILVRKSGQGVNLPDG